MYDTVAQRDESVGHECLLLFTFVLSHVPIDFIIPLYCSCIKILSENPWAHGDGLWAHEFCTKNH